MEWYMRGRAAAAMSVHVPAAGSYISAVVRARAGSFALPVPPVTSTLPSGRSVVLACRLL